MRSIRPSCRPQPFLQRRQGRVQVSDFREFVHVQARHPGQRPGRDALPQERPARDVIGAWGSTALVLFGVLAGAPAAFSCPGFSPAYRSPSPSWTWPRPPKTCVSGEKGLLRPGDEAGRRRAGFCHGGVQRDAGADPDATTPPWARARSGSAPSPTAPPPSSGSLAPICFATWFNKYWLDFVGPDDGAGGGRGGGSRASIPRAAVQCLDCLRPARIQAEEVLPGMRDTGCAGMTAIPMAAQPGDAAPSGNEFVGLHRVVRRHHRQQGGGGSIVRLNELQLRLVADSASVFLCQIDPGAPPQVCEPGLCAAITVRCRRGRQPGICPGSWGPRPMRRCATGLSDGTCPGSGRNSRWRWRMQSLGRRWIHARLRAGNARGRVTSRESSPFFPDMTERRRPHRSSSAPATRP